MRNIKLITVMASISPGSNEKYVSAFGNALGGVLYGLAIITLCLFLISQSLDIHSFLLYDASEIIKPIEKIGFVGANARLEGTDAFI